MAKSESGTGRRIRENFLSFEVNYIDTNETDYANGSFNKQEGLSHRYDVSFKGDKGCFSICVFKKDDKMVIGEGTCLSLNSFDRSIFISNDPSLIQLATRVLQSFPPK